MNETGKSFNKDINKFLDAQYTISSIYNFGRQDPLFLTFLVQFDFQSDKLEGASYANIGANFLNTSDSQSSTIETYYREINNWPTARKAHGMHKYFKSSLGNLENKTPWFFTSISGLEKALQYNENSAYWGGDDSVITIGCLETMDMRVSNLMQAYRDAIWDQGSWSWIVPDNLRKFNVTIWATDVRRMNALSERNWFKFNFSSCEFMLDSGNAAFADLTSSPNEQIVQSIAFKYENVAVESLASIKNNHNFTKAVALLPRTKNDQYLGESGNEKNDYLKEKFGDLSDVEASSTSPDADIKDINENLFNLQSTNNRFLSKGWIDQKNREITNRLKGGVDREWNNFKQDYKNKARDTARGLINEGISRVEEKIGNALGFDNFRANPSALANNVIKGLSDLSDRKSREALNSLLGTARNVEPLASDENVYGNIQQVLDEALDRKLQGYNNFIGQNPVGPGPLGPENVYDPE